MTYSKDAPVSIPSAPTNTNGLVPFAPTTAPAPSTLPATAVSIPVGPRPETTVSPAPIPRWKTLKGKATLVALGLGTLPVLIVGGVATVIANQQLSQTVIDNQEQLAAAVSNEMAQFVEDRLNDVQSIADNPLIFNSGIRNRAEPNSVLDYLNGYLERDPSYSALTVTAPNGAYAYLDGNVPVVVGEEIPAEAQDPTYRIFAERNVPYFLAVRDTLQPTVSPIRISSATGKSSFYIATPAFAPNSNTLSGVVYSRTVATDLSSAINERVGALLPSVEETGGETPVKFSVMDHSLAYFETTEEGNEKEIVSTRIQREGDAVIIDGQPFEPGGEIIEKENRVFVTSDDQGVGDEAQTLFSNYSALREGGVIATETEVSNADDQRYLVTYAPVESAGLGEDWGILVYEPTAIAFAARRTLILTLAGGTIIAALLAGLLANYLANRALEPISEASKAVTELGQGNLDVRLAVTGEDEFAVLSSNINTMADQLQELLLQLEESAQEQGIMQAQTEAAEEQKQHSEAMQQELIGLIRAVEGASEGDLTVRAELSSGEIGIVADVFNSIVESLRKIVVQVKQATTQVNDSIGSNQDSVRLLSDNALSQVEEISETLTSVQRMTDSIQSVADSAQRAAAVARDASDTAQKGGQAMDQTVDSILGLRSTVAETTKKVKQLGESSQQISQVVALINEIALKTNLLAINASIEAAHAGEEGQGFAVVAGEVGELAEQSASATKEIERIVRNIQDGTREVVEAMELSTSQVVEGTQKLSETKESLTQILNVSEEIDKLVQFISEATVSQVTTSQTVSQLMEQITEDSQQTSVFSKQVDDALQSTVSVAKELESAIDKFKVGSEAA
ncbi:MAG: methyl-accepting chemotaxis protein [Phormidesmis sp.]